MANLVDITDFADIIEFTDGYYFYKKDNKARAYLNKTLETEYKYVYRQKVYCEKQWKVGDIDWSGEQIIIVTKKLKVLRMHNSEWAFFEKL